MQHGSSTTREILKKIDMHAAELACQYSEGLSFGDALFMTAPLGEDSVLMLEKDPIVSFATHLVATSSLVHELKQALRSRNKENASLRQENMRLQAELKRLATTKDSLSLRVQPKQVTGMDFNPSFTAQQARQLSNHRDGGIHREMSDDDDSALSLGEQLSKRLADESAASQFLR